MSVPLRLLYGLNADGTPKRISMFPPSYAERARARAQKRREMMAGPKPPDTATSGKSDGKTSCCDHAATSASVQTDISYCAHRCDVHKPATSDKPGDEKRKQDKAAKSGPGTSEKQARKGDKKKTGKTKAPQTVEEGESSASEEADSEPDQKTAAKVSKKKKKEADAWDPATFPWLASLTLTPTTLPLETKRALAEAAKKDEESLSAARKADEAEAQRWISQQQTATHHGALKWLRERDVQRKTQATSSSAVDPATLAAALSITKKNRKPKHVSFDPLVQLSTPNPHRPLWATESDTDDDFTPPFAPRPAPHGQLVVFRDDNGTYTANGEPVHIVDRQPQVVTAAPWHSDHGRVLQEICPNPRMVAPHIGWQPNTPKPSHAQYLPQISQQWQSSYPAAPSGPRQTQHSEWANTNGNESWSAQQNGGKFDNHADHSNKVAASPNHCNCNSRESARRPNKWQAMNQDNSNGLNMDPPSPDNASASSKHSSGSNGESGGSPNKWLQQHQDQDLRWDTGGLSGSAEVASWNTGNQAGNAAVSGTQVQW